MLKLSIIGAGENAAGHARYYAECERAQVVAVYDPVDQRAAQVASICGAKAVDLSSAIEMADAVVIASPNAFHCDQAIRVAKAGRHVFIEKPMGLSQSEATRIRDAVRATQVRSCVGFSTRFSPSVATMVAAAEAGELGAIRSIWSRRLFSIDFATMPAWRRDAARSGGLLFEVNIHELDWMLHVGGPVESVYAVLRADSDHDRANDDLWFTIRFENGCVATHEGSWATTAANFYRGIRGSVSAMTTDEWGGSLYRCEPGRDRTAQPLSAAVDLRRNWLDSIEHGEPCLADVEWGHHVTCVAEAILDSAKSNRVVSIEHQTSARISL